MRITRKSRLLPEVQKGRPVNITVDGKAIEAFEGETIAAALISAGITLFRLSQKRKEPRSLYCQPRCVARKNLRSVSWLFLSCTQ